MLLKEIENYWDLRAEGFSQSNQDELNGSFAHFELIVSQLPNYAPISTMKALDVGCGPGIMGILLAQLGFKVTGLDLSPEMLNQARQNAQNHSVEIEYVQGNAMEPPFEHESFDVIITRNLTWNLPDPRLAYESWGKLLKPKGVLINFDGNHFYFYKDPSYDDPTRISSHKHLNGVDVSVIEKIAKNLELSHHLRPYYDLKLLEELGWGKATATILKSEEKDDKTLIRDFLITVTKHA